MLLLVFQRNLPIWHFFNALHPFDAACIGIYVYQIFYISLLFTKVHGEAPKAIVQDFGSRNIHR